MRARLSKHQVRAGDERQKEFPHRSIKTEGRLLEQPIRFRQRKLFAHPEQTIGNAAVRDHDSLRSAGRAGCVDDVGKVLVRDARPEVLRALPRNVLLFSIQTKDAYQV